MVSGDDSTRILNEVMRGITKSAKDTPEQKEHRAELVESVQKIKDQGGIVDSDRELP